MGRGGVVRVLDKRIPAGLGTRLCPYKVPVISASSIQTLLQGSQLSLWATQCLLALPRELSAYELSDISTHTLLLATHPCLLCPCPSDILRVENLEWFYMEFIRGYSLSPDAAVYAHIPQKPVLVQPHERLVPAEL